MRDKIINKGLDMKKYLLVLFVVLFSIGCTTKQNVNNDINGMNNTNISNIEYTENTRDRTSKVAIVHDDFLTENALHDAVRANDLPLVKFLVKQGILKNQRDEYGFTPLHIAVRLHNFEITKYLISKGSDVNTLDVYEDTPLLDSTRNNDTNISKELICNGAYRNVSDVHGMSTLNNSAKNNNKYISELLRADNITSYCNDEIKESKIIENPVVEKIVVKEPIEEEPINEELEIITSKIKINIDSVLNDKTPKICGDVLEGDVSSLDIVLTNENNESFGKYDAIINQDDQTWCADVTDELPNGLYDIVATGYDKDDNTATDKAQTEINVLDGLYDALMKEFKDDFEPWNAYLDKDTLVFKFRNPTILFKRGLKELQPRFENILTDFLPRYANVLKEYQAEIDEVWIEGHASSEHSLGKTIEEKYELNRILSDARANEVLNYSKKSAIDGLDDNFTWLNDSFKAIGKSSSQLVYNEDGTENRELSRRVEFRITTKEKN